MTKAHCILKIDFKNNFIVGNDEQMCALWSTTSPPDILEYTPPFDELVETFDFYFN